MWKGNMQKYNRGEAKYREIKDSTPIEKVVTKREKGGGREVLLPFKVLRDLTIFISMASAQTWVVL